MSEPEPTARITSGEVVKAFEASGRIPSRDLYIKDGEECAISAVLRSRGYKNRTRSFKKDEIEDCAERLFGRVYVTGFIFGFDGPGADRAFFENTDNERRRQGFQDGQAAARAVFGEDECEDSTTESSQPYSSQPTKSTSKKRPSSASLSVAL